MTSTKDEKKGTAEEAKLEAKGSTPAAEEARAAHEAEVSDEDEVEEDTAEAAAEDPMWWAPHVVLVALLLVGMTAMLGLFNPLVDKYRLRGGAASANAPAHAAATPVAPAAPNVHLPGALKKPH